MAYFPNGCSGEVFDTECATCKYGEYPCPIAGVQYRYNYEACNNKVAREILEALVKDYGRCEMKEFMNQFEDFDPNQSQLNLEDGGK